MAVKPTEHCFLGDYQPWRGTTVRGMVAMTAVNWAALYGVFYVIGLGLRHGLAL